MVRLQSIKRILEDLQKQIRSLRAASNEELRRTNNNTNLSASNNDSDDDDLEAATQLGERNVLYFIYLGTYINDVRFHYDIVILKNNTSYINSFHRTFRVITL